MATALLFVIIWVLIGIMVCVILAGLAKRRERRLALQRALVIEAANQRMRSVKQEALDAMLNVTQRRFGGR